MNLWSEAVECASRVSKREYELPGGEVVVHGGMREKEERATVPGLGPRSTSVILDEGTLLILFDGSIHANRWLGRAFHAMKRTFNGAPSCLNLREAEMNAWLLTNKSAEELCNSQFPWNEIPWLFADLDRKESEYRRK